jgi:predicted PurR-regulated permease PerM
MGTLDDLAYIAGVGRFFLDARTARVTWTLLVILASLGLAYALRGVLLLVALSLFFAYLLFPLVRLVERWLTRRALAIAVVYLVVLAALGEAGAAVGPRLTTEVQSLAQKLPEMSEGISGSTACPMRSSSPASEAPWSSFP